jgi:anaphase-promoting complex subunit 7
LKEYKLAESLFTKALQLNNSFKHKNIITSHNINNKLNNSQIDDDSLKYNLYLCLINDKKYNEAFLLLDSISTKDRSSRILMAMAKLCQYLNDPNEAINIYKEILKTVKLSLVAVESLLKLGIRSDDIINKIPDNLTIDWLISFIIGKGNLIYRENKSALKLFKNLDTNYFEHKSAHILMCLAYSEYINGDYTSSLVSFEKLHRLTPQFTTNMDIYAFLLYTDKSDYQISSSSIDKTITTLEKLANDMHQVSVGIPQTWTIIGYYSLKKKSQKSKCFAENVIEK